MIIMVIHGAMHKGITYAMTKAVLDKLGNDNEIHEFLCRQTHPATVSAVTTAFSKARNTARTLRKYSR